MENLAPLLEKLAEKLGTTSTYLWGVLVKQAFIDGILSIVFCVLVAVWTFALCRVHISFMKKDKYDGYGNGSIRSFIMGMLAILTLFLLIAVLICLYNIPTAFLNPEYWALKEVLSAIKPK